MPTIIKDRLADFDLAVLVRDDYGDHFVVSHIDHAFDWGGPETMAFAATPEGEVTSWQDVAGGRCLSIRDVIGRLAI